MLQVILMVKIYFERLVRVCLICVDSVSPFLNVFTEAKVGKFDVPILINENIIRFQISVNEVKVMNLLDSQNLDL